jgi:hypothetical protein
MTMIATADTRHTGAYDRLFFSGIAAAMALTVAVGFSSTYYLRFFDGGPRLTVSGGPMTPLVHLHAVLFSAWILLFVVQTTLIASRRAAIHRRLGVLGAALAAAMIVVGMTTARAAAARGSAPAGVDPLAFMAVPIFDIILFTGFVTAALVRRRNREAHKRLMILASVSIITAAIARVPGLNVGTPLVFFSIAFLFVIAGAVYDFVSRRRVHGVYLWGGALFALSVPLRLALSDTSLWRAFAEWFVR